MIGEHVQSSTAFDHYLRFRQHVSVKDDLFAFFRPEFLANRNWRAVVVSEELSHANAHSLARSCHRHGYSRAWALDIDHFDSDFFFEMQLTEAKLRCLESVFVTPSYLVVEREENFMLISDSDYYWSIAGQDSFLTGLFGRSLDQIDQEFLTAMEVYRASTIGKEIGQAALSSLGKSVSAV